LPGPIDSSELPRFQPRPICRENWTAVIPPEEEPLELLEDELEDDELELEELLEELELLLELDELLEEVPPPQSGATKLPSWLPWKPKEVDWPGFRLPFQLIFLAVTVLPEVVKSTFQLPVTCGGSLKFIATCQLLTALLPPLVTATSSW
jgi:hypothetical protein